jgi:hypothetical protein
MENLFNIILKIRFLILNLWKPIHKREVDTPDEWKCEQIYQTFDMPEFWMGGRPGYLLNHYPQRGFLFGYKNRTDEVCSEFYLRYTRLDLRFKCTNGNDLIAPLWVLSDPDLPEWDFEIKDNRLSTVVHSGWQYDKPGLKKRSRCNKLPFINFSKHTWIFTLEITPYCVRWLVNGVLLKRSRITSGGAKRVVISLYKGLNSDGLSRMNIGYLRIYKHKNELK